MCAAKPIACEQIATERPSDDREAEKIPLITGSTAEMYIRPMLPCVGDIDIMFHHSNTLAVPSRCTPPTQLPAEFHSCVKVCGIIDSEFPGYVFLKLRYYSTEIMH